MVSNFHEILIFEQFLKTATDGSQDQLTEEAQIAGYYISSLSDSGFRMILAT